MLRELERNHHDSGTPLDERAASDRSPRACATTNAGAPTWIMRRSPKMATTTQPTTEREHFLASFEREYQTTLRVLKAFPPAQGKLKFTDRSHTANEIAWSLVLDQMIVEP